MVNAIGKAINFFQDLYDKYKKFIDFLKNNPLSQFLGKINPFSNTSFESSAFINTSNEVDELGRPVFANAGNNINARFGDNLVMNNEPNFDAVGNVVTSPTLGTRNISNLSPMAQAAVRRSIELQETTAEIRAKIAARKASNGTSDATATTGNVTINVNAPTVIDEEGFTRAVVSALNNSTNRGTTGAGDLRTNAQIL